MSTFIGTILQLIGIIAAVSCVQIVTPLFAEEASLRSEPLLATSV